jgi:hypothetical protein
MGKGTVNNCLTKLNSTKMKTASIFLFAISLLGSCTAYQKAQWHKGGNESNHPMWGSSLQSGSCPHNPNSLNNNVGMSGTSIYSTQTGYYTFCPKCGRYVRGRQ